MFPCSMQDRKSWKPISFSDTLSILSCNFSNYFSPMETKGVVRKASKHATLLTRGDKWCFSALIEDATWAGQHRQCNFDNRTFHKSPFRFLDKIFAWNSDNPIPLVWLSIMYHFNQMLTSCWRSKYN